MSRKASRDQRVVRNRRVMIYTFLLILALFYIAAHNRLEKERQRADLNAMVMAEKENQQGADSEPIQKSGLKTGSRTGAADGEPEGLRLDEDDMWCLILTNAEYPVPEDYTVELTQIPGTEQYVDSRIYESLMGMMDRMKAEGLHPIVCSAYRTLDKQEKLFNQKVKNYVKRGHSKEEAYVLARQIISIPGSGEHCLGLAVDFFSRKYQKLEEDFENTPEGQWLREHSWEYGFTLRYDRGKEEITGIHYEPWHFRYVGTEVAKYLKEQELSLEEFYIQESLYG